MKALEPGFLQLDKSIPFRYYYLLLAIFFRKTIKFAGIYWDRCKDGVAGE
jgi:hypothetical protein